MIVTDLFESHQTCPKCGGPAFSDLVLAEKKDACYSKVRSRYKVWPSAYASGALVQCRKKGAANWGNKSEGVAEDDDGKDKFYYQRNNIWRVMDGDELVHKYTPDRYEVVGAKKLLSRFDDEGYDVTHVISPMGVVTYLYGKPEDEGVAEATGDQKFDSMMGQITGGATARQSVDSLNKSLTARTGSDPETALAKWGQEFINWLEKICRNFERQGVDRFNKLEKVGNLDDGGETMAHWLIEVAKQSNTSGITQADIQEFSSEFNTHGMWAWHQFPIAWGLKEWQDYKDQWTGPDGYIANLGQGMAEGLAQDEAEEDSGWRAEFVNEINYNTFEVKLTNTRSKESANFIVRPVDMVSYGPTLSIETMDVHDLQTGQTESWTNDDPAPDGPIAYAISGLFYDDKQLQKKLQNIIDTHDTKGQDMMPGLEKRRSIGQEVDADAYIDSQEKTQAAMAKMKKGVAEKLGDNRPKLGSKRDAGKSVRKWRKTRGLDETGVAETMATFSAKASTRNSGSGEFRGVSIPSDMKHPEWREPTWSFQEIAQKLGIPVATLNLLAFNRIGGFPEALSGLSARHGSKKYYKQSEVKRWVNANNVREKLKQGVAEGSLEELSTGLLQRAAQVAKDKRNKAMDPKIHNALGGGYMNPLAKHYDTVSQKLSNKAAKAGQQDAIEKIASPAVMRKMGMSGKGATEGVAEAGYGHRNPDLMSPGDYDRYQQDQMDHNKRDFKRREHEAEWEQEKAYSEKLAARDAGTWYIRINGKLLKDRQGQPYTFQGKAAANRAAATMMAKPFNAGKQFTLTTTAADRT